MATGKDVIKILTKHTGSLTKATKLARQINPNLTGFPGRTVSSQQMKNIVKKFEPTAIAQGVKLNKGGQGSYGFRQTLARKLSAPTEPKTSAPKEKKAVLSTYDFLEKIRHPKTIGAPDLSPKNNVVASGSALARQPNKT